MRTFLITSVVWLLSIVGLLADGIVKTEHVEAELVSQARVIQPGQPFSVALRLKMKPHWHVYWRNPGEAGLPTNIEWQLPEGFTAGELQWPFPQKLSFAGFIDYGYEDEVFLITEITPPANLANGEVVLNANADWLVCEDVCVPESAELSLKLSADADRPAVNERWVEVFADVRARLPLTSSDWQISAGLVDSTITITAEPPEWFTDDISDVYFYPYEAETINYSAAQIFRKENGQYALDLTIDRDREDPLTEISGVLVSDTGWRGAGSEKALEVKTALVSGVRRSAAASSEVGSLWIALGFAFVGGMILNLMPCVLPVLSMKILGFVQQAGEDKKKVFQHGLSFTFGVLASFWVLAGAMLVLRAGGEQLGWGFQLQSPTFITILSVFLFLFGLSLFGVFEIGTSLMSVGQGSASSGHFGSFMSGVTATVVATPCTAPFMGSALGFALSQPVFASMLIFTFLGLGMAFPYVLLASSPALLKFVPKPGPWMESLKQFMGFLLMATVIWLLWVLSFQAGADGVLVLLVALLIAGIAGWILGRWGNVGRAKGIRTAAQLLAIAGIVGAVLFSVGNIQVGSAMAATPASASGKTASNTSGTELQWQAFTPELVAQLRSEGKPVFIDFTAAWCLSCQVNKKVAFGSSDVQEAFQRLGITPVIADWTNRNEIIAEALAGFGRNSVPLYVLYGKDPAAAPIILPEILTPGIVLEALENL